MATERLDKKSRDHYLRQETFIAKALGINEDDALTDERMELSQLIYELDGNIKANEVNLFESDPRILTPANMSSYVEDMIAKSNEISTIATTMAPIWALDYIKIFMFDLERLIDLGDNRFRQNYVFFTRALNAALERNDMVALADLFGGECPSLLRSILNLRA